MGIVSSRFAPAAALLSALSMAATPALAAPISMPAAASAGQLPGMNGWKVEDETVNRQRWDDDRRGGYGRAHRRHHGGVDTGDVIAGVLLIGGIAAIASAASKSSRDKSARDDDYRSRDYPYRDAPGDYRGPSGDDRGDTRYSDSRGINDAVNSCVREAGRDGQVDEVESAERTDDGWRVEGSLRGGRDFSCETDNDGRVRNVDTDRSRASSDRQWDDERYARARDAQERGPDSGDENLRDDGRYGAGDVPDFAGGA